MDSREAFEVVSDAWLRVGWDNKYVYSFTWLGRPLIQMPEDVLRIQEVIHEVGPDVIVETGVAHGGSLMFYASLCKALDRGRVVGIDVEIRPHNRKGIEEHNLSSLITLIEGSSIDSGVVDQVRAEIGDGEVVVVILDSRHTREHVLAELEAYAPMVTRGSYVVVEDGCMGTGGWRPEKRPGLELEQSTRGHSRLPVATPGVLVRRATFSLQRGQRRETGDILASRLSAPRLMSDARTRDRYDGLHRLAPRSAARGQRRGRDRDCASWSLYSQGR